MVQKGYWIHEFQYNEGFEKPHYFEGYSDEEHEGYLFFNENEFLENIEHMTYLQGVGYVPNEDYEFLKEIIK